jgi:hypothetical protein
MTARRNSRCSAATIVRRRRQSDNKVLPAGTQLHHTNGTSYTAFDMCILKFVCRLPFICIPTPYLWLWYFRSQPKTNNQTFICTYQLIFATSLLTSGIMVCLNAFERDSVMRNGGRQAVRTGWACRTTFTFMTYGGGWGGGS